MSYKVVNPFADKMDNDHIYEVGDTYPRTGVKVSADRIKSLESGSNATGVALIQEVKKSSKKDD